MGALVGAELMPRLPPAAAFEGDASLRSRLERGVLAPEEAAINLSRKASSQALPTAVVDGGIVALQCDADEYMGVVWFPSG